MIVAMIISGNKENKKKKYLILIVSKILTFEKNHLLQITVAIL